MGVCLSHALESRLVERKGNEYFKAVAVSMQGKRLEMEDADTIEFLETHPNTGLFGVYDGHGCRLTAKYAAKHFWKRIAALPNLDSATIASTFLEFDQNLFAESKGGDVGGSTACVLLAQRLPEGDFDLTIANLGDSRAVMGLANGECIPLTVDHKPTDPLEMERIKKAGGTVEMGRVNGNLAVSRAFGDFPFKGSQSVSWAEQAVSALPDVRKMRRALTPDDFIIVCCDGIFEYFDNERLVKFIHEELQRPENITPDGPDLTRVMTNVLLAASAGGSRDNMSGILIQFRNGSSFGRAKEYILAEISPLNEEEDYFLNYVADAVVRGGLPKEQILQELRKRNTPNRILEMLNSQVDTRIIDTSDEL